MPRLAGHRLEGSSRMGMEMKNSSFGRARSMEYYSAHGGRPRTSREAKGRWRGVQSVVEQIQSPPTIFSDTYGVCDPLRDPFENTCLWR